MTCKHANYQRGCDTCRRTSAAANRHRRAAIREGRVRPPVPAQEVMPHVDRLRAAGMASTVIAARAGISRHTIQHLVHGRREHVLADVADAILAVQPEPVCRTVGEHSAGTARRLQALMTKGWGLTSVGERAGVPMTTLWHIAVGQNNTVATHIAAAVRDVYDELYATEGPSTRVRNTAARHGWPGPGAWDDDSIDNPDAAPDTGRARDDIVDPVAISEVLVGRLKFTDLREQEQLALFRDHLGDWGYKRITDLLKLSPSTIQRWRTRARYGTEQVAA